MNRTSISTQLTLLLYQPFVLILFPYQIELFLLTLPGQLTPMTYSGVIKTIQQTMIFWVEFTFLIKSLGLQIQKSVHAFQPTPTDAWITSWGISQGRSPVLTDSVSNWVLSITHPPDWESKLNQWAKTDLETNFPPNWMRFSYKNSLLTFFLSI